MASLSGSVAGVGWRSMVSSFRRLSTVSTTVRRVATLHSFSITPGVSRRFTSTTGTTEGATHNSYGHRSYFFGAYHTFRRERHAKQRRQYMTLSQYLDRLPPGFRELLLWSPLLALLHFTCRQAKEYYLEEEEPLYYVMLPQRWRHRNDGGNGGTIARVSSLLRRAPPSCTPTISVALEVGCPSATCSSPGACQETGTQESGRKEGVAATAYSFLAADVQDTAVSEGGARLLGSPPVASFHEILTRHAHAEESSSPAAVLSRSPEEVYRYGVWGAPLVVIRDPATQRVVGYSTAR